jgi:hypothetical protein
MAQFVFDLQSAVEAYWQAKTHREQQAAYHEILLFGGFDSYGFAGFGWRGAVVRWLRRLAYRIEGKRRAPASARRQPEHIKVNAVLRCLARQDEEARQLN